MPLDSASNGVIAGCALVGGGVRIFIDVFFVGDGSIMTGGCIEIQRDLRRECSRAGIWTYLSTWPSGRITRYSACPWLAARESELSALVGLVLVYRSAKVILPKLYGEAEQARSRLRSYLTETRLAPYNSAISYFCF